MNRREILRALELLRKHENELDVHDRLIINSYRKMAIEDNKEISSHLLERAQHYQNATIAAGYAAFFAAWSFFRVRYHNEWYDLSLLMMLFSVLIFVIWAVYANIVAGQDLFKRVRVMSNNAHNPIQQFEALREFESDLRDRVMRRNKFWWISLLLSIIPAAVAVVIFFWIVGSAVIVQITPLLVRLLDIF